MAEKTVGGLGTRLQVWRENCVAYSGEGFAEILAAYNLPVVAAAAPPSAPAPAKAEKKVWKLNADTLFDFNKAVVKAQFYPLLDEIADALKNDPATKAEIHGHTDNVGTNAYNQTLSVKRANAVLTYLTKKGIAASRLKAIGFGAKKPGASNKPKKNGPRIEELRCTRFNSSCPLV